MLDQKDYFVGCENLSLTHNLNVDPRLIGEEALLIPFAANVSAQRMNMFSSNIVQAVIIKGREYPLISTGFEAQFADYTFNPTRRNQPITIIGVIPKYLVNTGAYPIKQCHHVTIVYKGMHDGEINYFDIDTYTKCADGFGYINQIKNRHLLQPGNYVPEDVVFSHSPAIDGSKYMLGINANVAYMSIPEVAEDAFVISDEFADKLESTAINTIKTNITANQIPLNIHGDEDIYKIIPDIGDIVPENGIIAALRTVSENSIITDTRASALSSIQVHDDVIYAVPGATILDIEVYVNESRKIKTPQHIFEQPRAYWKNRLLYYQSMYELYLKCVQEHIPLSLNFIALMTRIMSMLTGYGEKLRDIPKMGKSPQFVIKREPIEHIHINITYQYTTKVSNGSKLTGDDGALKFILKHI